MHCTANSLSLHSRVTLRRDLKKDLHVWCWQSLPRLCAEGGVSRGLQNRDPQVQHSLFQKKSHNACGTVPSTLDLKPVSSGKAKSRGRLRGVKFLHGLP